MRRRKLLQAGGLAVIACAVLSGCTAPNGTATPPPTSTGGPPATPTTGPGTTPPPAPSATASEATPTATAAPRTDPNAPAGQCADARLAVSVQYDPRGAGAGQRGSFVVFRNTGDSECTLHGFPGVSLVGEGDGRQIGADAMQSGQMQGIPTVTIPAGSYALAAVGYPYIDKTGGAYGDGTPGGDPRCRAQKVDGYRVYPPHSFRAYFTRAGNLYGCSTGVQALRVSPVRPASEYSYFTPKP